MTAIGRIPERAAVSFPRVVIAADPPVTPCGLATDWLA